jgi:hypothetical protein
MRLEESEQMLETGAGEPEVPGHEPEGVPVPPSESMHDPEPELNTGDEIELGEEEVNTETGIRIGIHGVETRKSGLTKHSVYLIKGEDREGSIETFRRFNEFFKLRRILQGAWPGCYIPALPDKDPINKNDDEVIKKRQRMLGEFLRKLASLPHIFYSQEVQTLLRSKETDLTAILDKWPRPTSEDIINKYRDCFKELAGKEISSDTNAKITNFQACLKRHATLIGNYKDMARRMAESRGKFNNLGAILFATALPTYERTCIKELIEGSASKLLYEQERNPAKAHGDLAVAALKHNPYWLIYDIMKLEERDGEAMIAAIKDKDLLEERAKQIEFKIRENETEIHSVATGGKTLKSMITKGSKEDYKTKLQTENQALTHERENVGVLIDIISALLAHITIDQYTVSKKSLYYTRLKKLIRI